MKDEDREIAEQLALEHTNAVEAMKFLRGESSLSLRECCWWVRRLVQDHPDSALAKDVADHDARGSRVFSL